MNRTLFLAMVRSLKNQLRQFVSLTLILTLGIGFYIGIRVTGEDMRTTADAYYASHRLMDLRLISTMGFDQESVELVKQVSLIDQVSAECSVDANARSGDRDFIVRVMELHTEEDAVNRPLLVSGRLPESETECLIDDLYTRTDDVKLGQTVTLFLEEEAQLSRTKFTVVGTVKSPLYITLDRGYTSIGSGKLNAYLFVDPSVFAMEYQTDLYLTVTGAQGKAAYSDEYEEAVKAARQQLEPILTQIGNARLEAVQKPLEQEYQNGLQKWRSQEDHVHKQLAHGEEKLKQSQLRLQEAQEQWRAGATRLASSLGVVLKPGANSAVWLQQLQQAVTKQENQVIQAQHGFQQLQESYADYEDGMAAYQSECSQLQRRQETAQAALAESKAKLEADRLEWEQSQTTFLQQVQAFYNAIGAQPPALSTVEEGMEAVRLVSESVDTAKQAQLLSTGQQLMAAKQLWQGQWAIWEETQTQTAVSLKQGQQTLEETARLLDQAEIQLRQSILELATALGLDQTSQSSDALMAQIQQALQKSDDGVSQAKASIEMLADSLSQQQTGEAAYRSGLSEYQTQRKSAEDGLAKGKQKLQEARQQLDSLQAPTLYVRARKDNPGYSDYLQDSQRIEAIGRVFPMIFFLVAALVCLSAITRLVEEHRTEMGTLKALGYPKGATAVPYLFFAISASLIGLALGAVIGYRLLPVVIYNAYRTLYSTPDLIHPFIGSVMVCPAILAVVSTVLTVLVACRLALRSVPAELMRPPAPKAGKRVFLERITPLWKRLSFLKKVTARNLLRNRSRFWMSVLGIAGCMGLLITGLGLNHSIMSLVPRQFGKITHYQMQVVLSGGETDARQVEQFLAEKPTPTHTLSFYNKSAAGSVDGIQYDVNVTVLPSGASPDAFFTLAQYRSGEPVPLSDEGAVIDEKLAQLLGLHIGDSLSLFNEAEGIDCQVKVTGIVENYVYHYVFLSQTYAEQVMGKNFPCNVMYVNTDCPQDEAVESELCRQLLLQDGVTGVVRARDIRNMFDDMMGNFKIVIAVIVLAAAALALVVLYNLSEINISERKREIATLKVLGFFPRETWAYIYRENMVLTLLGIVLGTGFGWVLHRFVTRTAEIDLVMFVRELEPWSILAAAVLTAAFSFLVNLLIYGKLRRINMVEALKSVE